MHLPDLGGHNDLAVAIDEDEDVEGINADGIFQPAAIEYDPDSKPPIFIHRRMRICMLAASILLCITLLSAGIIVVVSYKNNVPQGSIEMSSSTPSPSVSS